MRALILLSLASCLSCSLVISDRTKPYEGACSEVEEAVGATYGDRGRTVTEIAADCRGCAEEDCVERCIRRNTDQLVTFECAACFADAALCQQDRCPDCAVAGSCGACFCREGCALELNECSGLRLASCPQP